MKVVYILKALWLLFAYGFVIEKLFDNIIAGEIFKNWDTLIENGLVVTIIWAIPVGISLIGGFNNLLEEASLGLKGSISSLIIYGLLVFLLYKALPFIVCLLFLYNIIYLIATFNSTWRY